MVHASPQRWSVTDLTRYIRQMFDLDYRLQDVEVEGEVSNMSRPGSGHIYFTLKDEQAALSCVMWRSNAEGLTHLPESGDRVVASGSLGVYEARGQYQLYARTIRAAGQGDLAAQLEALKASLAAEGLFDAERKRPLPTLPQTIGIVTGAGTAALQDVLNVLGRRYPLARAILSPTPVQGDAAPPQIVAALEAVQSIPDLDVILLVRGGGSLEDLWAFNDERVVRAVAASKIPVVSGVGHEIDFTLVDFAADMRAPTPSAAAEQITPYTADDLRAATQAYQVRLHDAMDTELTDLQDTVTLLHAQLERLSPSRQIAEGRQRVDDLLARAGRAARSGLSLKQERLTGATRALEAISPAATLARGYAIVRDANGNVLRRATDVDSGDRLAVQLYEGALSVIVDEDTNE